MDLVAVWTLSVRCGVIVVAGAVAIMIRRAAATAAVEGGMWRWTSRGVHVLVSGLIIDSGAALMTAAGWSVGDTHGVALEIAVLAATPLFYRGLINWNRVSTAISDPGDWLNGLSAVLALTGLETALLEWTGGSTEHLWQAQLRLLAVAAAVVVAGTSASVSELSGLRGDRRVWLVTASFVLLSVSLLACAPGFLAGSRGGTVPNATYAGCAAALAVLVVAARRESASGGAVEATPYATVTGAIVVLAVGVVLLLLGDHPGFASPIPAAYGLLAVVGSIARLAHIVRDLAQLTQSRLLAATDELTGLGNRRALMTKLRVSGSNGGASLLILDLGRFKEVNDTYGHPVGDALLQSIADRLRSAVGGRGLLARLGGDEFAVLIDAGGLGTDELGIRLSRPEAALTIAHALVAAASRAVDIDGRRVQVGASVGVASVDRGGDGAADLLRRADIALYVAKRSDHDIVVYDDRTHSAMQERLTRVGELKAVLTDGSHVGDQIVVHYQPQVDMRRNEVVSVEALVRWHSPRLGLLAPDEFLPLVEEYGLMPALTERVLRAAAIQAVAWQQSGRTMQMSVNLSATSLTDPGLLPLLRSVLLDTELDPALLTLEITETTVMSDPQHGLTMLRQMAAMGVGISIDDYGTGHASLAYLNDLPATELKLDRSFVARITSDPRTAAIVAATIDLARRLELRVVAEGVDDNRTLLALAELNCHRTQGYLHSPALTAGQFDSWLAKRAATPFPDLVPTGTATSGGPTPTPPDAAPTPALALGAALEHPMEQRLRATHTILTPDYRPHQGRHHRKSWADPQTSHDQQQELEIN